MMQSLKEIGIGRLQSRVRCSVQIELSGPYKPVNAAGEDGIFPAMHQKGLEHKRDPGEPLPGQLTYTMEESYCNIHIKSKQAERLGKIM